MGRVGGARVRYKRVNREIEKMKNGSPSDLALE